jgi:uncharacterized protein (TIGR02600 family)
MKTTAPIFHPSPASRRGAALIVVLGSIVLLSVIVVAFFSSVRSEYQSARGFADGASVRSLANSTVQLVQAQIQHATTNNNLGWASQPGMIRTFDSQGSLRDIYRLYSWSSLREATTRFTVADEFDQLRTWNSRPAGFTDINSPVVNASGTNYPILNPDLVNKIEGFAISDTLTVASPSANRAPMPVQWLYVLSQGQVIAPDSGASTRASFTSGVKPSPNNPIVGRIAFWTDDETCKLNINTASEGTPWDTPRNNSFSELGQSVDQDTGAPGLASSVPSNNEYQRIPGHPAMTCLSPALGAWMPSTNAPSGWSPDAYIRYYTGCVGRYIALTPRVNGATARNAPGGSESGSRKTSFRDADGDGRPDIEINPDADRLYPSVDEYLFNVATRTTNALTAATIDALRFFLTPSSRAPDITPFNTPRICLWPRTSQSGGTTNVRDALIDFCSQLNGHSYSFHRGLAGYESTPSAVYRVAEGTANYSDWLTRPGTGNRNPDLYNYLKNLMSRDVPGLGGNFQSKYGPNAAQIRASMIDYLRSTVNIWQRIVFSGTQEKNYRYTADLVTQTSAGGGNAYVAPGLYPDTGGPYIGFGRSPVVTEVGIMFYATNRSTGPGPVTIGLQAVLYIQPTLLSPGEPQMSPWVRYEFSGLNTLNAITKSDGSAGSLSFPSGPISVTSRMNCGYGSQDGRHPYGNALSPFGRHTTGSPKPLALDASRPEINYNFGSYTPVQVQESNNVQWAGGTVTLKLYPGAGTESQPFQTYTITFPPCTIRPVYTATAPIGYGDQVNNAGEIVNYRNGFIPNRAVTRSLVVSTAPPVGGDFRLVALRRDVPADYFVKAPNYDNPGIRQTHTLRAGALELGAGTSSTMNLGSFGQIRERTLDGLGVTPDPYASLPIRPPGALGDIPGPDPRILSGQLIRNGGLYNPVCASVTPVGLNGAVNINGKPGDWDNGSGGFPDGPYINMADHCGPLRGNDGTAGPYGTMYFLGRHGFMAFPAPPAREIASAVSFGSLPSGAVPGHSSSSPWQTLLFCPHPQSRTTPASGTPNQSDHFGFGVRGSVVPDHALLEFFNMPVIEPYPISDPLSTAGKVNLNSQIMPFTHITRTTALRGILKSIRPVGMVGMDARPSSYDDNIYKARVFEMTSATANQIGIRSQNQLTFESRYDVNRDATITGWNRRFSDDDIYRHASEVCELFLVPTRISAPTSPPYGAAQNPPQNYDNVLSWWNLSSANAPQSERDQEPCVTGDNSREAPYAQIYPRLTTRSNTYTVHMRVQTLKQTPGSIAAGEWDEGRDAVTSEYRGSTTIERYVDPNDKRIPDFATAWTGAPNSPNLNAYYRFRVISQKQFSP